VNLFVYLVKDKTKSEFMQKARDKKRLPKGPKMVMQQYKKLCFGI